MEKDYLTPTQAARILGISRMQVVRKIHKGEIKAKRVGRNFIISKVELNPIFRPASERELAAVDKAVDRVVREYGETLKRLGRE